MKIANSTRCIDARCSDLDRLMQRLRSPLQETDYLSDRDGGIRAGVFKQRWFNFGYDAATARTGGTGSPLQIGKQQFTRGLGHHANGADLVQLRGQYTGFRVWSRSVAGGTRAAGLRVAVDGEVSFEAGPMSDSDPARPIDIPLTGPRNCDSSRRCRRRLRLRHGQLVEAGSIATRCSRVWAEHRLFRRNPAPPLLPRPAASP